MSGLQPLLRQMIDRWRAADVKIPDGVNETQIAKFEARYGVKLPSDMREYFLTVNGMGNRAEMDDNLYGFWALEEVQSVEAYRPDVARRFPASAEYYLFFDYSIDLFMYGIRLSHDDHETTPIAKIYPQDDGSFTQSYESFTSLISAYISDPDDLL